MCSRGFGCFGSIHHVGYRNLQSGKGTEEYIERKNYTPIQVKTGRCPAHNFGFPAGGIRRPHAADIWGGVREPMVVCRHIAPNGVGLWMGRRLRLTVAAAKCFVGDYLPAHGADVEMVSAVSMPLWFLKQVRRRRDEIEIGPGRPT